MISPALQNLSTAIRAGVKTVLSLDLTVSPTSVSGAIVNGLTYTSPELVTTAIGGVGPFTYAWTSDGSDIAITSSTSSRTTLTASDSDVTISENITCLITDAALATASVIVPISVVFGLTFAASTANTVLTLDVPNGIYTTDAETVTVFGGSGSYTYSWVRTQGIGITATSPFAATTAFSGNFTDFFVEVTFTCTVTDTVTNLTATTDVNINLGFGSYTPL